MKKIFFIDTDVSLTRLYATLLNIDGIRTVAINSGLEAIRRLSVEKPDLVVLDLYMPDVDGVEVFRFIRGEESLKELPVIIFSQGDIKSLIEKANSLEAQNILVKGQCKPKELVDEIKAVLAGQAEFEEEQQEGSALDTATTHLAEIDPDELPQFMELLRNDPRSEARRVCLIHINKIMHDVFQCALTADETLPHGKLGRALKTLLNDLYTHPDHASESTIQTLIQGRNKLNMLCEKIQNKLNSETVLEELLDTLDD